MHGMGDTGDFGTVGWSSLAGATLGITRGQTLRLCAVNIGPTACKVAYGLWTNPRASLLAQQAFTLEPGESRCIDLPAASVPKEALDKSDRAQIRAVVRHGCKAVCANLEVFDDKTGRTSVVLPLQEFRPDC
jgi:hypothetical protein